MAQEKTTLARPYAEAVFARAQETAQLDRWSDRLEWLNAVVQSPELSGLIKNPRWPRERLLALFLDLGADVLGPEGENLLRVLLHNDRLILLPDIAVLYAQIKRERQGLLQVQVRAAYPLDATEIQTLATVLQARLQREIQITAATEASLIGGVLIRAGDWVIDGSVRGQLGRLANELRI